jgi:hypothetical protein
MRIYQTQLTATTIADGSATANDEERVFGFLYAVEWIDGSFDDGVDAILSCQSTVSGVAQTLLTLTNANDDAIYYPRAIVHSEAGVALTGTAGADRTRMMLNGKLRLVIAQGGNVKTGGCIVYYTEG